MSKQLVTAIGILVCVGVIALGVFLVALPLYFQAISVDTQTATVAGTNAIYQSQVDELRAQEENLEEINADVDRLRAQVPVVAQNDDVFEVVARAADSADVTLTAVTAGGAAPFEMRTGVEGEAVAAEAPAEAEAGTADDADGSTDADAPAAEGTSRQQVSFSITAQASDMDQVTSFIDALQDGPRLVSVISATTAEGGEGTIDVQVSAMTYVDTEG